MGADIVLPGGRVNDLVVEVVNHLHPVDVLLGVHEVVLMAPCCFSLSLTVFFILSLLELHFIFP